MVGGKAYARWPGLHAEQLYGPGDLQVTTDFRDVLGEIVAKRLGNQSLGDVFPGFATFNFHGIVREG
ncbi:hypothetical protein SE17_35930 [Kouleothrix aurantiaca]|uniref:Uncharacterized protein n=1 Tax=Kouleothrix aurantiaca TaxID=186479 RepID=A0A0N8PR37_9CHLR|nr:hypothetical protein SE17_35930 [Kouleothrix aurantiaca]